MYSIMYCMNDLRQDLAIDVYADLQYMSTGVKMC